MTPDDFESALARLARRPRPHDDVNEAWNQLRAATVDTETDRGATAPRVQRRVGTAVTVPPARKLGWIGGVAVLASVVFVLVRAPGSSGASVTHTYHTPVGQKATLTLVDGTRVTLAPQTTLRLERFGERVRTVTLDGEAYFEVRHAAGAPFTVRTGGMMTTVLGTAFMVRHYADDARVRVAVAEGKVSVTGRALPAPGLPLTAGHVGDISDSTVHVSTVDDLSPQTEWMRGKLIFRDAPVLEVLATLSRWYGFHFRCNDSSLAQQTITAGLSTQSSAAALSTLEQVLGARAAIAGDTVTLVPRSTRPAHQNTRPQSYDVFTPTREVGR